MADHAKTNFKALLMKAGVDLDAAGDSIRASLHMTNTSIDTEEDVTVNSGFTTSDEFDGSGYAAGGQVLDNQIVNTDNANDRGEFNADDEVFATLGNGTRQIAGTLIYKFNTTWADSIPLAWIESGGFPFDPNSGNVTLQWNTEGIIQTT